MLSRRSALLRPAPTASRPPNAFPGITGYRQASLPANPQATGPRRLSPVPRTTIRTFNAQYAGGFFSARSWIPGAFHGLRRRLNGSAPSWPTQTAGSLDDACSGFTHVADRTVASAPLRTRPLDHARGHNYRGPRRLPRPDSHRQAALNLSLGLRHDDLLLFMAPEQSGRTTRKRKREHDRRARSHLVPREHPRRFRDASFHRKARRSGGVRG